MHQFFSEGGVQYTDRRLYGDQAGFFSFELYIYNCINSLSSTYEVLFYLVSKLLFAITCNDLK